MIFFKNLFLSPFFPRFWIPKFYKIKNRGRKIGEISEKWDPKTGQNGRKNGPKMGPVFRPVFLPVFHKFSIQKRGKKRGWKMGEHSIVFSTRFSVRFSKKNRTRKTVRKNGDDNSGTTTKNDEAKPHPSLFSPICGRRPPVLLLF